MAAFVPPSGWTPAGTPALPARGLLHGRRSSRNLRGTQVTRLVASAPTENLEELLERLRQAFYGGDARAIDEPTLESLEKIRRQDLVEFYKAYYRPRNRLLGVAGNISADAIVAGFALSLESVNGVLSQRMQAREYALPAQGSRFILRRSAR
jgi:hypothetical protein